MCDEKVKYHIAVSGFNEMMFLSYLGVLEPVEIQLNIIRV